MKLPPSSILASVALAGLPRISASAVQFQTDGLVDSSNAATASRELSKHESIDADTIDMGILGASASPDSLSSVNSPLFHRKLQSSSSVTILNSTNTASNSTSSNSNCPSTCSSALCSCVSAYGYAEPCSQQLHDICTGVNGTSIADCVGEGYLFYYQYVYCPFASCRVGGGTYEACQCQSYVDFCSIYQSKPGYENDNKTLTYCGIANCCQGKTDDEGRATCLERSFKAAKEEEAAAAAEASKADGTSGASGAVPTQSPVAAPQVGMQSDSSAAAGSSGGDVKSGASNVNGVSGSTVAVAAGIFTWLFV